MSFYSGTPRFFLGLLIFLLEESRTPVFKILVRSLNVMRHFLALLSMLSDIHPAYHLTNPCTRSIRKERYICNYDLFLKCLKWVHLSF